jgi:hypothetical protein
MQRSIGRMVLAAALLLGPVTATSLAHAKAGDVVKTGACSVSSTWKLKLSPDNGAIQLEFQVDQNVAGQTWRVRINRNGDRIFTGKRVTKDPSGSFTVRLNATNTAGTDRFRAAATNVATAESCVGRASIG